MDNFVLIDVTYKQNIARQHYIGKQRALSLDMCLVPTIVSVIGYSYV